MTIEEHDEAVAEKLGLTEEQLGELHNDGPDTEFRYRMRWTRTGLKNAGTLAKSSPGVWVLTDLGRTVDEAELEELAKRSRDQAREARSARGGPDELDDEAAWAEELLDRLTAIPADGFERLAQRILREAGFINVEVLGRVGDGGIDGVGHIRLSSLVSVPVFFQCKRYTGTVGPNHVRDFRGAMAGRGEKGLLITTGTFTRSAKYEASRDGAPPIELIDGQRLTELLKEHGLGVQVTTVEQVTVDGDFFDQF